MYRETKTNDMETNIATSFTNNYTKLVLKIPENY